MATDRQLQAAMSRLERLGAERPELSRLAQVNVRILQALFDSDYASRPAVEFSENARRGLANGTPLLRANAPQLDGGAIKTRWIAICETLSDLADSESALALAEAVRQGRVDPAAQLSAVLVHGNESFRDALDQQGLDVPLGLTVLRLAALPELEPLARDQNQLVQESHWDKGECPICGEWPLLAELRGLDQLRWLRCGRCAAQWPVDRLFCPFCGQRDHHQLQDLTVEGDETRYRLSVCDACGGSLPLIATLQRLSPPELLVAEAETLHLRFIAQQQGYRALDG